MSFYELAEKRVSVRSYTDKSVEADKITKLLEIADLAPTAANRQPIRVLVIQSEDGLKKVEKAANTYKAPLVLLFLADESEVWERPYDKANTLDIDASIVADHVMLEATELGLGSVWICYFDPAVIREEFNLPETVRPVNILAIGYEDDISKRRPKQRKGYEQIVFHEQYGKQ